MARPLNELGSAITLVLFPKASGIGPEEAIAVSGLAARLGLFAMAAVGAVLIVIAPILLGLCFGAEFVAAVAVFRWIVLAVILSATGDILAQAFTATGRPGTISILRCIEIAILARPASLAGAGIWHDGCGLGNRRRSRLATSSGVARVVSVGPWYPAAAAVHYASRSEADASQ